MLVVSYKILWAKYLDFERGELFGFCGRNIWIFVKANYLDFIIIDFERNTPPCLVVLRTRQPKEREVYLRIPPIHYEEYTRYMRNVIAHIFIFVSVGRRTILAR